VTADDVRADLAQQVAAFKLPRHIRVLPQLPRTSTGKLLRDAAALRKAGEAARAAEMQTPETAPAPSATAAAAAAGPSLASQAVSAA